ncbi:hypothetical protein KSD_83130 [Ktedonobacter sp. SOSP1-85]|uniref:hypothetical protein n=1 Tax=Ktedonobacter sp. SOSP1-85 TaxID=2778367 RepID=UPI001916B1F8|nr:hypothetical protein [Ktedonobacter sp. SOSP1-85]GHO80542.1 hypothetical protein KSD_83130 [Ktedonobacter sp. SOSP1-85]
MKTLSHTDRLEASHSTNLAELSNQAQQISRQFQMLPTSNDLDRMQSALQQFQVLEGAVRTIIDQAEAIQKHLNASVNSFLDTLLRATTEEPEQVGQLLANIENAPSESKQAALYDLLGYVSPEAAAIYVRHPELIHLSYDRVQAKLAQPHLPTFYTLMANQIPSPHDPIYSLFKVLGAWLDVGRDQDQPDFEHLESRVWKIFTLNEAALKLGSYRPDDRLRPTMQPHLQASKEALFQHLLAGDAASLTHLHELRRTHTLQRLKEELGADGDYPSVLTEFEYIEMERLDRLKITLYSVKHPDFEQLLMREAEIERPVQTGDELMYVIGRDRATGEARLVFHPRWLAGEQVTHYMLLALMGNLAGLFAGTCRLRRTDCFAFYCEQMDSQQRTQVLQQEQLFRELFSKPPFSTLVEQHHPYTLIYVDDATGHLHSDEKNRQLALDVFKENGIYVPAHAMHWEEWKKPVLW